MHTYDNKQNAKSKRHYQNEWSDEMGSHNSLCAFSNKMKAQNDIKNENNKMAIILQS